MVWTPRATPAARCEEGATSQHSDAPSAQPAPTDPEAAGAAPVRPPAPLIPRASAPADPDAGGDPADLPPYAGLAAAAPLDAEQQSEPAGQPLSGEPLSGEPSSGQRTRHLIVAALAAGVGAAALVASASAGDLISITSLTGVLFLGVAAARYSLARNA